MTTVIEQHAAIGAARDAAPPSQVVSPWRRWWPAFAVLGLTVFAVAIRWWALSYYDGEMWGDEATLMNEARRFLTGEYRGPFINDALGNPALFSFLLAQVFRVTGVSVAVARAYTGAWGALGVPLLYGLARELGLRRSIALAAAALLATASWHVHLSRMVVINVTGATTVGLVLYCAAATIRRRDPRWAALTGVALAVAMNSYIGARVVVLILGFWLGCLCLFNGPPLRALLVRRRRDEALAGFVTDPASVRLPGSAGVPSVPASGQGRLEAGAPNDGSLLEAGAPRPKDTRLPGVAASSVRVEMTDSRFEVSFRQVAAYSGIALAVATVLTAPLIWYYLLHPDVFSSHTIAVFAFSPAAMQRLFGLHPELPHSVWGVAQYQFAKTIGMFTTQGSTDVWFNMPGRPMLDGISSAFLVAGLLLCLWTWRQPRSSLVLSWVLLVYVFGAFMAIDPPSAHKTIPISPALCLVIAVGIDAVARQLHRLAPLFARIRAAAKHPGSAGTQRSQDEASPTPDRRPAGSRRSQEDERGPAGSRRSQEDERGRAGRPSSQAVPGAFVGIALAGVVVVIGLVNIQREIAYETSTQYQAFMSNAALAWGRYLGSVGTPAASVVSPLGYSGEFPRLFAPRATLCNAEWTGQWQRCPAARVVIFDAGADADAARYAAVTHHAVHSGPVRFGRRLFWYAIASGTASLPDPSTVLSHASAS